MANKDHPESTYVKWIREQGLPIIGGYGVESVLGLPRAPWRRLGGSGTFIKLEGFEGVTGMYVAEIPPAGTLNPEKHLYEELIYILQGRGATELYAPGSEKKSVFEWQAGSLLSVPLNTWHRLSNGSGTEPAVFLGFTNAPMILDIFHRPEFVFGDNYVFDDRYDGRADYFTDESQYTTVQSGDLRWLTNFVSDVRQARLLAGKLEVGHGR